MQRINNKEQITAFKKLLEERKEIIRQFNIDVDLLSEMKLFAVEVGGTLNERFEFTTYKLMHDFLNVIAYNLTI